MIKESKAKKALKSDNLQKDLIAKGFRKLDKSLISSKPPKINWGGLYKGFNDKEKIEYLEKLCATMNHAAYLIQEERNKLLKLVDKKEELVEKAKKAMEDNMEMVHSEIAKLNLEKQKMNKNSVKLRGDSIKEYLKNVNNIRSNS